MLLANYNVFNANPGHAVGGITDPTYYYKAGVFQQFYYGDSAVSGQTEKASFFIAGGAPHYSFVFAPKAGGMSSRNNVTVGSEGSAYLVGGKPITATATITLTATGNGGLIVSGSGTATVTISATGAILSIAAGSGTSTVTMTASAALGALAGLVGTANVTITPQAAIAAIGYMAGISTSEAEFSPSALAAAVWSALASDYNESGTMGEKMNSAGSAGNPWTEVIEGAYTAEDLLKLISAVLLGKVSGAGTGTESFRDVNDSTDRVVASVDSSGNRTSITLDAS